MSKLPDAAPIPDKPPLHLKGEKLLAVSPLDFSEACFSVPAMRAFKRFRPLGKLVVFCPESLRSLWSSVPEVDSVVGYPDKASARKLATLLSGGGYDSAIFWEYSDAVKAVSRLGVQQRFGYPAKGLEKWLTDPIHRVVDPGPIEHRVRYYLGLVQSLGGEAFVRTNFQTVPLPEAPSGLRIALARKSEYGDAYQWPEEKFELLQQKMEQKHGAIEWLDVNSPEEASQLLVSCSALLACDGEVAHWAAHLGLPAVVLFGPGEPEWKRPLGRQSRVIREHVACSPCYLAKCPFDLRCQNSVTVDQVMAELERALAERSER